MAALSMFMFMFTLFLNLRIQFMYTERFFGNATDSHPRFFPLYKVMYFHIIIKNQFSSTAHFVYFVLSFFPQVELYLSLSTLYLRSIVYPL
jgi:hypothetical protein